MYNYKYQNTFDISLSPSDTAYTCVYRESIFEEKHRPSVSFFCLSHMLYC